MIVTRTTADVRDALGGRPDGTVGLVPTMGALHPGHEALLRAAREECDTVVASLFVNPSQFAPDEDVDRYPRDEEGDLAAFEAAGVDVAFAPEPQTIYPPGYQTWVEVTDVGRGLEGDSRPDHFRGVATVCLRLFLIVRPDRAYFGQKDAQQAALVERLVRDLELPIVVHVIPTVRDDDGLAFSSRNAYLSRDERDAALALPRALDAGERAWLVGRDPADAAREQLAAEPRLETDYVEVAEWNGRRVLAAAVRAGTTRLIDNVVLEEDR